MCKKQNLGITDLLKKKKKGCGGVGGLKCCLKCPAKFSSMMSSYDSTSGILLYNNQARSFPVCCHQEAA